MCKLGKIQMHTVADRAGRRYREAGIWGKEAQNFSS